MITSVNAFSLWKTHPDPPLREGVECAFPQDSIMFLTRPAAI